ncbi:uncharacterized protein LOC133528962 [Cydia pomonella]|uniref:uncharacterized protein LOC133528962 n=1 Tax=Cydia pomonella TaxID=82600 RepID=UPI002ADD5D81|nr:uncharacterized protein LOC133528962 [Cydia pomonella]
MKYTFVLMCALLAVVSVSGQGIPIPKKNCPPGERSVLHCPRMAEPDCIIPRMHDFVDRRLRPCGEPDCFCELPTVRDRSTHKCVRLDECPKKEDQ